MLTRRASGILLHISSLPSTYGIGDFGPEAYKFVDFLVRARQSLWQVLPMNPTTPVAHHSPYDATSAFAGNPLLISPKLLQEQRLLDEDDVRATANVSAQAVGSTHSGVDYARVYSEKFALLGKAYKRFRTQPEHEDFRRFCEEHASWLNDYAIFEALRSSSPHPMWRDWPAALRDRQERDMTDINAELKEAVQREKFFQYLFFEQWNKLKKYANERGVRIIGDIPFYVGLDSADVWAHPDMFKLTTEKKPHVVAGVPPDYFSETGQLWGNPVYDWQRLEESRYAWWIARLRHNLSMFDIVRIDHFRGFAAHWEVPAESKTAATGKWVHGPGKRFFGEVFRHFPFVPIIAEDLGAVTHDVRELLDVFQLPGMEVLLFAFDGEAAGNSHSPHNHIPNNVLYTGTHDNNTLRGWFDDEADAQRRERLFEYIGRRVQASEVNWELIRMAMMSVSRMVIIPMQDILGLGSTARMNRPATLSGNWEWRMQPDHAAYDSADKLARLTTIYGRA